jgi:peptidoglycan/xylan/chitin deacetylase (PgdA/CDA1 family)
MVVILTYHKVLDPCPGERPDFYTVSPRRLDEHLRLLRSRGYRFLTLGEAVDAAPPDDACILTFDDATADHHETVFPMLARHEVRATFFVPTEKLDRPASLTRAQVTEMARAGHLMANHSHRHVRLDRLPPAEIRDQLLTSQEILAALTGERPVAFAPPGGYCGGKVPDIAGEIGFRAVRTMRWGHNRIWNPSRLECLPINRHVDERRLSNLIGGRHAGLLGSIYSGKEALKSILPTGAYEALRGAADNLRKR